MAATPTPVVLKPLSVHGPACPVESVTVFNDRAEVTRNVALEAVQPGDYTLVIDSLTRYVDPDSIRVKGAGHVVLQEVSNSKVVKPRPHVTETADNAESAEVATQQLTEVTEAIAALGRETAAVLRQKQLWDRYVSTRLAAPRGDGRVEPEALDAHLTAALQVMEQDAAKQAEFSEQLAALKEAKSQKETHESVLRQRIAAASSNSSKMWTFYDVTVVLTVTKVTDLALQLVYMTSEAGWTPAYDIRITSTSTDLELTYHGMLKQRTGEDWNATQIILSTATPSVGGSPPALSTHTVSQWTPPVQRYAELRMRAPAMNVQAAMWQTEALDDVVMDMEEAKLPEAAVTTTAVEQKGGSATFTIERRATIASDNKPHKVTVTVIKLASAFRYYCVPALSPHAYLQAITTNTSEYLLLASTAVNVFFDGDFVSHSKLDLVNPGEKFNSFLGVDSTVKVDYKSIPSHHSSAGLLSRTAVAAYKFHTTVKNTKAFDIRFILADFCPRSGDEGIRVRLITPTQEEVDAGAEVEAKAEAVVGGPTPDVQVAQNKVSNNIVWNRVVKAGQEVVIPYEYLVESPAGQAIEIA